MIDLELKAKCPIIPAAPSEAPEDILGMLDIACEMLQESECVEFHVGGFGQEQWPTDVRTDLLTALEQLPHVSSAIRMGEPEFDLDFYEQGIGRRLAFVRAGDIVRVTCISATDWIPNPSAVTVAVAELCAILDKLRRDFVQLAKLRCPSLSRSTLLHDWSVAAAFQGVGTL